MQYNPKSYGTKILACAFFLSHALLLSQNQDPNYFITEKEGWYICSPAVPTGPDRYAADTNIPHTLERLTYLGEQANNLWHNKENDIQLITSYLNLFDEIDNNFISDVIDQILTNDELRKKVTQASYKNATGFLKVVLVDGGANAWKIRLHVWQEKEEREFAHNHKWDFYSKIITGYLKQHIYVPTDNLQDPTTQLYNVREPISLMPLGADGTKPCPCRDTYELQAKSCRINNVYLRVASENIIGRGESYMMPNQFTHTITPGRGAVSFVFTSRTKTENSEVFIPIDRVESDLTRVAPSVTEEELIEELIHVKALLSQLQIRPEYLPETVTIDHRYFDPKAPMFNPSEWRSFIARTGTSKRVLQLSKKERNRYRVTADENGCVMINNQPIDGNREYLFVLVDNALFAAPKDFDHQSDELICHTSFTDYGPAVCAGILQCNNDGNLIKLEAYSGHYAPSKEDLHHAQAYLQSIGIQTKDTVYVDYQDR